MLLPQFLTDVLSVPGRPRFHPVLCALLVVVTSLGCGSCSSTPSADDEPPTEDAPTANIQLPESIPNSTRVLMRIDPEGTARLIETLGAHLGLDEELPAQHQIDWGDATIQFILSGGSPGISPSEDTAFSERTPGESIVIALGWPDDDPTLRNLRFGAPYSGEEFANIPLGVRIFIPSQNPEALIKEVDEYCEDTPFACAALSHMKVDDSYAVLDVALAAAMSSPQENLFPEANSEVFERKTLAARGFLESDATFSAYMRTESVSELGAMMGLLEMWMALEQAAPEDRLQLLSMGLSLVHTIFVADSPESREVEDFATAIEVTDDGDVDVLNYETLTEQGRRIYSAGEAEVKAPSIDLEDPALELEWSRDIASAWDASSTPFWLSKLADEEQGLASVAEAFRDGGIWMYHLAWSSYRNSFPAGLEALVDATDDIADNPLTTARGLVGLRAALNVSPDRSSPVGVAPTGAIVAVIEPDSPARKFVDTALDGQGEFLEQLGIDITLRDEDPYHLLMLSSHGEDVFGSPTAIDELQAAIDASNLDIDSRFVEEVAGPEFAALPDTGLHLSAQRTSSEAGLVTRLSTAAEADLPRVPTMSVSPANPEEFSECFRLAVIESPGGLEALSHGEDPRKTAYQTRARIDEVRSACDDLPPGEADDLRWLSARWLAQMALVDVFRLRFDDARTHFHTACDEGDDYACQQNEALADWDFQLAAVGTPALTLPPLPSSVGGGDFPVATSSGLFELGIGRFQQIEFLSPTAIDELDPAEASDPHIGDDTRLQRLVQPVEIPDEGLINLAYLAPERSMPAAKVQRLIDLFENEHSELSDDYKWNQPWELRDELSTELSGVALVVDADVEDKTPAIAFGFQDTGLDDDTRLSVELDARGIDVAIGATSLPSVDGCDDDGPTICIDDDSHPWRDDSIFEQLGQLLGEHADTTPEGVVISTGDDVPFEAVANSASTVWASFDFEEKNALSFVLTAD